MFFYRKVDGGFLRNSIEIAPGCRDKRLDLLRFRGWVVFVSVFEYPGGPLPAMFAQLGLEELYVAMLKIDRGPNFSHNAQEIALVTKERMAELIKFPSLSAASFTDVEKI